MSYYTCTWVSAQWYRNKWAVLGEKGRKQAKNEVHVCQSELVESSVLPPIYH